MPVLANPLNQIGVSDLVSKDLMDKFHNFLAHTYVTIGQVKGRTLLPLPPNDVTSNREDLQQRQGSHSRRYVTSFKILINLNFRRYYHVDQAN